MGYRNVLTRLVSYVAGLTLIVGGVVAGSVVPGIGGVAQAVAATSGECGASYDEDYDWEDYESSVVNAQKVLWAGKTWDVIGISDSTSGVVKGVAGPDGTVTLLLDNSSYVLADRTVFNADYLDGNAYSGSTLQSKLAAEFAALSADLQSQVVKRDLVGSSSVSVGSGTSSDTSGNGYTGDSVAGAPVLAQGFWPLSVREVSQLRASVRSYGSPWWLRSPGTSSSYAAVVDSDGDVYGYGDDVDYVDAGRPALFLNLTSSGVLSGSALSSVNVGVCPVKPTVDIGGYTWDIIGFNGDGQTALPVGKHGVAGDISNSATLLLSISSAKKFEFPSQSYAGKIYGQYDINDCDWDEDTESWTGCSNAYSGSDLKAAFDAAYVSVSTAFVAAGATIIPRDLPGGAVYDDDTAGVAGPSVVGAGLWPLSTQEARSLNNQERIYGDYWWLRSPGGNSSYAAIVFYHGYVYGYGSHVDDNDAGRPALLAHLSSNIVEKISASVSGGDDPFGEYEPPAPDPSPSPSSFPSQSVPPPPPTVEAVPDVIVSGVSSKVSKSVVAVGKTVKLSYTVLPANATNKTVGFASSNTKVATVDAAGVVKGIKAGSVKITTTAVVGGKSHSVTLKVVKPVTSIKSVVKSKVLKKGKSFTLKPKVNGTKPKVTFKSSKKSVAAVSAKGKVVAKKKGKATVTVTAKTADGSKKTKKITVTVK